MSISRPFETNPTNQIQSEKDTDPRENALPQLPLATCQQILLPIDIYTPDIVSLQPTPFEFELSIPILKWNIFPFVKPSKPKAMTTEEAIAAADAPVAETVPTPAPAAEDSTAADGAADAKPKKAKEPKAKKPRKPRAAASHPPYLEVC